MSVFLGVVSKNGAEAGNGKRSISICSKCGALMACCVVGGQTGHIPCHYRKTSGELTRVSRAERVMKANYRTGTDHCDNTILCILKAPTTHVTFLYL